MTALQSCGPSWGAQETIILDGLCRLDFGVKSSGKSRAFCHVSEFYWPNFAFTLAHILRICPNLVMGFAFRTRIDMRKKSLGLVFGVLSLGAVSVQAAPITLTPVFNPQRDLSWQNIEGTSYSFADVNANNRVDVGETVSFSVVMDKANWGTHDYDALKFWIYAPGSSTDLFTGTGVWDFDVSDVNMSQPWSYRPWYGPTKTFTFAYTFASAGDFNLAASVMCSADLSDLVGAMDHNPTQADWDAWTRTAHFVNPVYQGETEFYKLKVYDAPAVPEPGTLALFLLGFVGLAGSRYFRKK